jgi:transposase-like protein
MTKKHIENIINEKGELLCNGCKLYKSRENFTKSSRKGSEKRGFLHSKCKDCTRKYGRERDAKMSQSLDGMLKLILKNTQYNAKVRNIEFDTNITKAFLLELYDKQKGICNISGEYMTLRDNQLKNPTLISIDRINSDIGYTKENIQLVCWEINRMKMDKTEKEFIYWCNIITTYQNDKNKNNINS